VRLVCGHKCLDWQINCVSQAAAQLLFSLAGLDGAVSGAWPVLSNRCRLLRTWSASSGSGCSGQAGRPRSRANSSTSSPISGYAQGVRLRIGVNPDLIAYQRGTVRRLPRISFVTRLNAMPVEVEDRHHKRVVAVVNFQ
jgi:hypothetical protein